MNLFWNIGNEMLPFIISYEVKTIKYHLRLIEEIRLHTLQRERAASSIAHSINGDEGEGGGGENRAEPSEFIKKSNRGSSVRPSASVGENPGQKSSVRKGNEQDGSKREGQP